MSTFRALLLTKTEDGHSLAEAQLTDADLMAGDVDVRVTNSTVNFKDGLVLQRKVPVRRYPMIPGIDFAGTVTASSNPKFKVGDDVILNGYGA